MLGLCKQHKIVRKVKKKTMLYMFHQFKHAIVFFNLYRRRQMYIYSWSDTLCSRVLCFQTGIPRSFYLCLSGMHRWRGSIMAEDPGSWNGIGVSVQTDQTGLARWYPVTVLSHLLVSQLMAHYLFRQSCASSGYKATKTALHPLAQIWLVSPNWHRSYVLYFFCLFFFK